MNRRLAILAAVASLAAPATAQADLVRVKPDRVKNFRCFDFDRYSVLFVRASGELRRMRVVGESDDLAVDYKRGRTEVHVSTTVDQTKRIVWNKGPHTILYDPTSDCSTKESR